MTDLKQKYWLIVLPLMAIAVLILVTKLKPAPKTVEGAVPPPLVEVATVGEKLVTPFATGYGRVRPKETWQALSEVSGRIVYRHPQLEKGQLLKADTLLLRVDPVDYELKLAQAKSDLSSAQAELKRTELNDSKLQLSLKLEQQQLAIFESELTRKKGLLKNGSVSQSTVDQEARNVLAQQQKVLDIENSIKQFPSDLEVVKAKVELAESRLKEAQRKLDKTRIYMPFDARIANVDAEPEQVIKEGQMLVLAHRFDVMEIPVQVAMSEMRDFARSLGEPTRQTLGYPDIKSWDLQAEIKLYVGNNSFIWSGTLANVGESIDPHGNTVTLVVEVDMSDTEFNPALKPPLINDMYVEVKVISEPVSMPVIPVDAVRGNRVYLLSADNKLVIRPVVLAFESGDKVAVVQGLKKGDVLIISDIIPAVEGMALRHMEAAQ